MSLKGYDVLINGSLVPAGEMPLAKPGDFMTYESLLAGNRATAGRLPRFRTPGELKGQAVGPG